MSTQDKWGKNLTRKVTKGGAHGVGEQSIKTDCLPVSERCDRRGKSFCGGSLKKYGRVEKKGRKK